MPARVNKIRHDDETRAKIQAAQIINRFHQCIMGDIELSSAQVSAGKTLLGKVLPDLSAVQMDANVTSSHEDALDELDGSGEADTPASA